MTITNRRPKNKFGVAFAWQTNDTTPASISNARFFVASDVSSERGQIAIDPQGTHGSMFMKDTHREVAIRPRVSITIFGAREFLSFLLEAATFGQPSVSNADITESGDTAGVLSNWSLTGVRVGYNTDNAAKLYVTLDADAPSAGQNTVSLYKDAARTQLVAQGIGGDNTTITLSEQNSSGLSGSVDIGAASADNSNIELTLNKITYNFAALPTRKFTTFITDGTDMYKYVGCVVNLLECSSEDESPLVCRVEIWALNEVNEPAAGTITIPAMNVYSHHDLIFTTDVAGTPTTQSPKSFVWTITNNLSDPLAGGATPAVIFNRSVDLTLTCRLEPSDEAEALLDKGRAGTYEQIRAQYTLGLKTFEVTWNKAKVINPTGRSFRGDDIGEIEISMICREVLDASSPAMIITLQP
ncbi:MAG: hypothetical protein KatS3mg087_1303 [Patescibacteria group bacterium]|nr:MAG: hypothetical protein KatS3mg087_1303 [Patescibacteria group bacterium]